MSPTTSQGDFIKICAGPGTREQWSFIGKCVAWPVMVLGVSVTSGERSVTPRSQQKADLLWEK